MTRKLEILREKLERHYLRELELMCEALELSEEDAKELRIWILEECKGVKAIRELRAKAESVRRFTMAIPAKYELVELAAIYRIDCEADCSQCPLGKRIVEIPDQMEKLPGNYTLCYLFDYMNLNKPDKTSV